MSRSPMQTSHADQQQLDHRPEFSSAGDTELCRDISTRWSKAQLGCELEVVVAPHGGCSIIEQSADVGT